MNYVHQPPGKNLEGLRLPLTPTISEEEAGVAALFGRPNYCDGATDWSLDVRFTGACDSGCSFCIAAPDMKVHRKFDLEALKAGTLATKATTLSIIGGEPLLLMKHLHKYVTWVQEACPHITGIHVTTSLPATVHTQEALFMDLLTRITSLNVSVQHHEEARNNAILRSKHPFNRLEALGHLLEVHPQAQDKIRVHLNLSKSGLATEADLVAALEKLYSLGVRHIKLNELMQAPEEYVSFEALTGMDLPSPYYHGCSTPLDYFPAMDITLKRSCFVVEPSRPASKLDLLKLEAKAVYPGLSKDPTVERVLYEDGSTATHWLAGEPQ